MTAAGTPKPRPRDASRVRIAFVTGNRGKVAEAAHRLMEAQVEVEQLDLDPVEIQADTLEDVARAKAEWVAARHAGAFFVDDAGLFVDGLGGFPGVYSAYALKTIGTAGILKLLDGADDRAARFVAVIGYKAPGEDVRLFRGECAGRIADAPQSSGHGFGFDPIFVPEGESRTFAELPLDVKNGISHRGRALDAFVAWLRG